MSVVRPGSAMLVCLLCSDVALLVGREAGAAESGSTDAAAFHRPTSPAAEAAIIIEASSTAASGLSDAEGFSRAADQRARWDEEALRRDGVERLADLDRYDPRLSIVDDGRGGIGDIRLRGSGGNRVQVVLDAVPLADDLAGRDYVDPLLLGAVEAVFGPGSSRYGSDALAGSLRFRSLHPDDLVGAGEPWYGELRGFTSTLDASLGLHGRLAHAGDGHAWLVAATDRLSREPDPVGEAEHSDQDIHSRSALGAVRVDASPGWRLTLTVDGFDQDVDATFADTALDASHGDDDHRRGRLSLAQEVGADADPWLRSTVFFQVTDSTERTTASDFARSPGNFNRVVSATGSFEQQVVGGLLHLFLAPDPVSSLVLGGDLRATHTEDLQERRTRLAMSPSASSDPPTRSFPVSDALIGGVFAEYERDLAGGTWGLELGARVDAYLLDVRIDDAYRRSLAGQNAPTDLEDAAPTGRAAIIYRPDETYTAHLKLATGYRNGRYDEANQAFTNFTNGYTISPNPDLAPERSLGLEVGLRRDQDGLAWECTGHYTWYRDFIERVFVGTVPNEPGIGPFATLAQYQSINRERIAIWGLDLLGSVELPAGFRLRGTVSWIDGEDSDSGETLHELPPLRGFAGLSWTDPGTGLRLEALVRAADRKQGLEDDEAFVPDAWMALDLRLAWWLGDRARLDLAWINVLDQRYWRWEEVASLREDDSQAAKDFHAATAGHLTAALTLTF